MTDNGTERRVNVLLWNYIRECREKEEESSPDGFSVWLSARLGTGGTREETGA